MKSPPAHNSFGRSLAQFAFALAVLAATLRVVYLAHSQTPPVAASTAYGHPEGGSATEGSRTPGTPDSSLRSAPLRMTTAPAATTQRDRDAELAELYQACPLAAVIDLDTVAHHPERIDEILPPPRDAANAVTLTAGVDSQPVAPGRPPVATVTQPPADLAPAVPRIRYPVHVADGPRLAASTPKPTTNSDWLVDPKEWFGEARGASDEARGAGNDVQPANPRAPSPEPPAPAAQPPSTAPIFGPPPLTLPQAETPTVPPTHRPTDVGGNTTSPPATTAPATIDVAPETPDVPPTATPSPNVEQPATAPTPTQEQLPTPPSAPASNVQDPVTGFGTPPMQPPASAGGLGTSASPAPSPQSPAPGAQPPAVDPHLELYTKSAYPSARECAVCHEETYHEWSISAHAYAAVSPMFNKFEQRLNDLSQGTVGYFCMRCHAPVATSLCASRAQPLWTLPEAAREGITCVACHRVQYAYGKSNGERRIETADIHGPVFGGIGGDGVAQAIGNKDQFKVKTDPNDKGPGQDIHITGVYFQPLTRSEFCTPCHQVAVYPGIKLEVVWEQYRASPACKKGIQCQDCHMGRVPGLPLGYNCGPVAKVNGKTVNDNRKKSNHIFFGPNYPIAHPGVFPFHLKANRWTMDQWLTFDWRTGWGTKEFEEQVADGKIACTFPPLWAEADDRYDAREIIDDNLKKLNLKRDLRIQVMENGSKVEGPIFDSKLCRGQDLDFHYIITNTNDGHNLLTASLGAQPQLWGNVVLIGPDGNRLWETGYTDSIGDVANIHSMDVRNKKLPFDWQLFNLQTMFLITGAKGTDREFFVPVNLDFDQLPFIRPGTQPITTLNHPPFIRMESQSLAPLGSRQVPYRVPGNLLKQPGRYRLSFRMRNRAEPIYFMRFCGATPEMERSMNEWMIDVHPISVEFDVQ